MREARGTSGYTHALRNIDANRQSESFWKSA
jgi:hypothetical protein